MTPINPEVSPHPCPCHAWYLKEILQPHLHLLLCCVERSIPGPRGPLWTDFACPVVSSHVARVVAESSDCDTTGQAKMSRGSEAMLDDHVLDQRQGLPAEPMSTIWAKPLGSWSGGVLPLSLLLLLTASWLSWLSWLRRHC